MNTLGYKIKRIRLSLKMSQEQLAEKLGLKRTTLSQIENSERKLTAEELIKLARIFHISVDELADLQKAPEVILPEQKRQNKSQTNIRINVPQKKLEKFKEVLLYILNEVGSKHNVGETVIYKLLYFIDFDFYEKYEEQLVGAAYIKNQYGPTPIEFKKIVENMIENGEIEKVESSYFSYPQTKYLPRKKADLSQLKANEIEVINTVLNKLSNFTARQISDYSHDDVPWLTTEDGKIIEYESVFYRTPAYSVREYADEDI